jgi:hypothetical protein
LLQFDLKWHKRSFFGFLRVPVAKRRKQKIKELGFSLISFLGNQTMPNILSFMHLSDFALKLENSAHLLVRFRFSRPQIMKNLETNSLISFNCLHFLSEQRKYIPLCFASRVFTYLFVLVLNGKIKLS